MSKCDQKTDVPTITIRLNHAFNEDTLTDPSWDVIRQVSSGGVEKTVVRATFGYKAADLEDCKRVFERALMHGWITLECECERILKGKSLFIRNALPKAFPYEEKSEAHMGWAKEAWKQKRLLDMRADATSRLIEAKRVRYKGLFEDVKQ